MKNKEEFLIKSGGKSKCTILFDEWGTELASLIDKEILDTLLNNGDWPLNTMLRHENSDIWGVE